jgi:phosphatidylinositol-3-phosphatase
VAVVVLLLTAVAACSGQASAPKAGMNSGSLLNPDEPQRSGAPTETRDGATPSNRTSGSTAASATSAGIVPEFQHIVVVVLENHAFGEIVGAADAPFLNDLASRGAVLTQSYAVTHPSQPNYLALFSGSTQGLTNDSCPHSYVGPNLASALLASGRTFRGYADDLPSPGFTGCSSGAYARKHCPWVDFPALPREVNQPMTSFPASLDELPTVSFVIPNLNNDMHNGSVARGDAWLRDHLGGYAGWAATHDSLLIVTADEDDQSAANRIATIFVGAHVRPGRYAQRIDHYGVLRTMLDSNRLAAIGLAADASPVTAIWS